MGQLDPDYDLIRARIAERNLSRTQQYGKAVLELELCLTDPLRAEEREALETEWKWSTRHRSSGHLTPHSLRIEAKGSKIRLVLDAFDSRVLRLDRVIHAFKNAGSPLGSPLSAWLIGAIAARLRPLHEVGRADGSLSLRHVLVGPGGGVALIAAGTPLIRSLIVPAEPKSIRLRRTAPETLLNGARFAASDVYTLGTLYYELLAGTPYRVSAGPSVLRAAAQAELAPDLPGALPNPRRHLLDFLSSCLAVQPDQRPSSAHAFIEGLKIELRRSETHLTDRKTLARLLEEYVPASVPRGPDSLLSEGRSESSLPAESPLPGSTPKRAKPPQGFNPEDSPTLIGLPPKPPRPPTAQPTSASPKLSGWAEILGEAPDIELEESSIAAEEAPPEIIQPSTPNSAESMRLSFPSPRGEPQADNPLAVKAGLPNPHASPLRKLDRNPKPATVPTLDDAARLPPKAILIGLSIPLLAITIVTLMAFLQGPGEPTKKPDLSLIPRSTSPQPTPANTVVRQVPTEPVATRGTRQRTPEPQPSLPYRFIPAKQPKALGLVSIMSNPSGATVRIDGGYVGRTPLVIKHPEKLNSKLYHVEVLADKHEPWTKDVRPVNGSISLVAQLEPLASNNLR